MQSRGLNMIDHDWTGYNYIIVYLCLFLLLLLHISKYQLIYLFLAVIPRLSKVIYDICLWWWIVETTVVEHGPEKYTQQKWWDLQLPTKQQFWLPFGFLYKIPNGNIQDNNPSYNCCPKSSAVARTSTHNGFHPEGASLRTWHRHCRGSRSRILSNFNPQDVLQMILRQPTGWFIAVLSTGHISWTKNHYDSWVCGS